jgi:hypothetical protein
MTRRTQGFAVIDSISAWTFSRDLLVLPRASVAASSHLLETGVQAVIAWDRLPGEVTES